MMVARIRRLATGAVVLALVGALAGCTFGSPYENIPSEGGVAKDDVIAALESVPGIESAEYVPEPWESGTGRNAASGVTFYLILTFDEQHHVVDPAGFLDAAYQTVWAINDGFSPKGRVVVVLQNGADLDYDWYADQKALFGEEFLEGYADNVGPARALIPSPSGGTLALGPRVLAALDDDVEQRFGAWPADAAPDLADFVAPGAPEPTQPFAIADASLVLRNNSENRCWNANWTTQHSRELGVIFDGVTTATLYVDGVEWGSVESSPSMPNFASFCGDDLVGIGDSLTLTVTTPGDADFLPMTFEGITVTER